MKARRPGHDPGHEPGDEPGDERDGFSWADYVAWLVERHGSLASAALRLAELRAFRDDAASIERALRRLRTRGRRDGGSWGARALAAFGLPEAVDARARWLGAYHSRFTELPLPVCEGLLRHWDRPPISEAPSSATFLALAHATCALRRGDRARAELHLQRARAARRSAPADARAELLLTEAYVARDPSRLEEVGPVLAEPMAAHDRACLRARWIDQRAHARNAVGDHAGAEALHRSIPADGPSFAACRRANGLAYARFRQGFRDEAIALAREAVRHAGDGGHVRHRGMALAMLARILGSPEGDEARARAIAIARALEDEALRLRFEPRGR